MKKNLKYIIIAIVFIGLGVTGTIITLHYFPLNKGTVTENKNVTIKEEGSISEAVNEVYDSVVLVQTYKNKQLLGTGTGFVYKKDEKNGYIMTNHHVIEEGTEFKITLITGEVIDAKLLGSDEYSDIAVLSIAPDKVLQVAKFGNSQSSKIGDTVFTVGSPLGADYMGTVTKGILSGKDRAIETSTGNNGLIMEVLQTDAAINPGNSGGPLVNIRGEVIGVNSMKLVKDEIEGMGFAIPIEIASNAANVLEKGQKINRPLLGIQLIDIDNPYLLNRYELTVPKNITKGVVIAGVEDNGTAKENDLKKGDIITKINGEEIKNVAHFRFVLFKYQVGDKIEIEFVRDSKIKKIEIKLNKGIEG